MALQGLTRALRCALPSPPLRRAALLCSPLAPAARGVARASTRAAAAAAAAAASAPRTRPARPGAPLGARAAHGGAEPPPLS